MAKPFPASSKLLEEIDAINRHSLLRDRLTNIYGAHVLACLCTGVWARAGLWTVFR
jgi:hypothetical protein